MAIKLFKWFKRSEPKQTEEMVKQNINLVKPNTPASKPTKGKKQQDTHLYTKVISYSPAGIVFLISYTEEYFYPMIEFMSLLTGCSIASVAMKSSYDEASNNTDKYGEPLLISHDRYYILFSCEEDAMQYLFHENINLGNEVLLNLTQDIYEYCSQYSFKEACNDGILNKAMFKENNNPSDVQKFYGYYAKDGYFIEYMSGYRILEQLPDAFNARDILDLIVVKTKQQESDEWQSIISLYDIVQDTNNSPEYNLNLYRPVFEALLNKPVGIEDYKRLALARYFYYDDPYDDNGKMSDEELDDIFKETYEKFNAVSSDDVQYEDIDEQIGNDEETENMRMEDIISDEEDT